MTVGEITFDMALSSGSQLQLVDVSGLQPLSFTPPSPEAVERFVSAMNAEPVQSDPLRFAAASLSIDKPVAMRQDAVPSSVVDTAATPVMPVVAEVEKPVVRTVVAEKPTITLPVVEKPVVIEKPISADDHVDAMRQDAAPPSVVDTPAAPAMPGALAYRLHWEVRHLAASRQHGRLRRSASR